jgi:N-methylhydantoinase A
VGGAHIGATKGAPDLLCVDMGGTSYDVSVVQDGAAPPEVGWNWHHRYLIAVPMIKVETLGAGGGSICRVRGGVLEVGPESAGADPGPICYARGGERPTITDANLILGLLSEQAEFAGGSLQLSRKGVDEAFEKHVAQPLGCGVAEAAHDCWRVVNANMTQAVRRVTADRGIDPTGLTMLAYGGNGPLFAAIQAQELGIDRVLVPKASPAFSALGALAARPQIDEELSYLVSADRADPAKLRELWSGLLVRAERYFGDAGLAREKILARLSLQLRYPGQNWSLGVDVAQHRGLSDLSFVDAEMLTQAIERFHEYHENEYGHRRSGEVPEITGVRLTSSTEVSAPRFGAGFAAAPREPEPGSSRRANLGRGFQETGVYRGDGLRPGDIVHSPAIIEETFTTIAVHPGWQARIDDAGDCELSRSDASWRS